MTLNLKLLRRSFSLRNNVAEDNEDNNVATDTLWPKISSSVYIPSKDKKVKLNSFGEQNALNVKMEYLMPYTRLKPTHSTGMQVTYVAKNEPEPSANLSSAKCLVNRNKSPASNVSKQSFVQLKGSSELEMAPTKMSKKQLKVAQDQLKKLTKINIHLHALFSAVEMGQSDKAKSILESTDVNVNCINTDALSPLDVAVLTNNRPLTKILLEHGACHGAQFKNTNSLGNHINSLLEDALNKINDFTCGSSADIGDYDADKQIDFWQRRANSLQRILRGWVKSTTPNAPANVIVEVTSSNSVAIKVHESAGGAITTKFKIQWSLTADFGSIIDEREINDLTNSQGVMTSTLHLYNLIHGQRYHFRALSGNIKGWSEHCLSTPSSVVPSSWQDLVNKTAPVKKPSIDDILAKARSVRKLTSSEIQLDAPVAQGLCIKKKATIKQLFTATSKFQKHLSRGIYLACLFYHDGKVLLTNDDLLPVIEIDENYPNNFNYCYPWLMKLSCNWDVVKALRNEMEKYSSSEDQFRLKVLSALAQMQSAMGVKDLGHFHFKPLQDTQGIVVFSCINYIKNPKSISVLNSRWISLRKIQRKLLPISDASNINEIILASIPNQIEYHQTALLKLPKGLYVGYLKMHCSMEQMHVIVPTNTPNVLPHQKVRDNPHVCADEWETLQETFDQQQKSEMQKRFVNAISSAAMRLFKYMGMSTDCMLKHKLYNLKLIQLSHDVTFLVICPPIELSCGLATPGQREMLLQRADLMSVPTKAFEMSQLFAYNSDITHKSTRLSIVLDLELAEANYFHREAFSTCEIQAAKDHLNQMEQMKNDVFDYWKSILWLLDVMTFTRNRCSDSGISMRSILNVEAAQTEAVEEKQDCKLVRGGNVSTRRSPCRVSWPNNYRKEQTTSELSKSDQQLNFIVSKVNYRRTAAAAVGSRRNSADVNYPRCLHASEESVNHFVDRCSLCKSDETLSTSRQSFSPLLQRKRSKTISARICSSKCVRCENSLSASSTHDDHTTESEPFESKSVPVTVHSYINDMDNGKGTKSQSNLTGDTDKENICSVDDNANIDSTEFGTIQVYVANESSDNGICLRLHVTTLTTAREIVNLVVKQCQRTGRQNDGKSWCSQLDSNDFCLFAIFGNRGRCVPDNFRPLHLQNPWKQGRLFVRRTHDIRTEIEHSQRGIQAI